MVYVPYYMASVCSNFEKIGTGYKTKGTVYSDYIILQSDKLKTAYEYSGIESEKLLVTGSPKIDKIYEMMAGEKKVKEEWQPALKDRKVLLFCSSINDLLGYDDWLRSTNAVVDNVLADKSLALLWRPHPLLFRTMQILKKDYVKEYERICEKVREAENGVIDESGDFGDALTASDGMIGDFSSLVLQYTFSGKPVLLLRGNSEGRKMEVFCDYFSNYFLSEGTTIKDFIEMIKDGRDERKEERVRMAKASVANADGTCGEKTHETVIQRICFWE